MRVIIVMYVNTHVKHLTNDTIVIYTVPTLIIIIESKGTMSSEYRNACQNSDMSNDNDDKHEGDWFYFSTHHASSRIGK